MSAPCNHLFIFPYHLHRFHRHQLRDQLLTPPFLLRHVPNLSASVVVVLPPITPMRTTSPSRAPRSIIQQHLNVATPIGPANGTCTPLFTALEHLTVWLTAPNPSIHVHYHHHQSNKKFALHHQARLSATLLTIIFTDASASSPSLTTIESNFRPQTLHCPVLLIPLI